MRVQIVCAEHTSDQVLARLVRTLADGTGWSLGQQPDAGAEVNLFFPYLTWDGRWHETPVAGEFSHRDTSIRGKAALWDRAAKGVDLRCTWSQLSARALEPLGPTRIVAVPLDREQFRPGAKRPARKRPRVGVSGTVYRGGRKGELLVAQLGSSPLGKRIELVGSGEGWPCPTTRHAWDRVPAWYQNLDVLICTSTIEGVPYPPLEALACGVRVVVPMGVGLLDELPDAPGLWRYPAGDGAALQRALGLALVEPFDAEALRATTERFTVAAWCQDHADALALLHPAEVVVAEPPVPAIAVEQPAPVPPPGDPRIPWRGRAGVYCVAYGDPARMCATRLVASLRGHMPGLPVAIASDTPLGAGEDMLVQHADEDLGGRSVKTRIDELAPADWAYVVYLDADTELVAPINALLDPLADGWDLAICPNPPRYALVRDGKRPDNVDELEATVQQIGTAEQLQWNGGVFAYQRSARTAAFFRAWHAAWAEYGKRDQYALLRALWQHPLRIWLLGRDFNATDRYDEWTERTAIRHYPLEARRWRGIVKGRLDSGEAWASLHPSPLEVRR